MKFINLISMSRIGRKKIKIPDTVTLKLENDKIGVKGPKGELFFNFSKKIEVNQEEQSILVKPKDINKLGSKALWGTTRMLIANMIKGVTKGYTKKLEINGTGYKAAVSGKKLVMELGFSHPVEIEAPEGIEFSVDKNIITVSGIDKQLVGEIAARIRSKRKPEPYKGKGVRYKDEYVRRKTGKKAVGEDE